MDEIYCFILKKKNRVYVYTAMGIDPAGQPHYFFYLSYGKQWADVDAFARQLPDADVIYSDGNPAYKEKWGKKNIAQKGVKTNLIESVNSQFRQYCSNIKRKTKGFSKNFENLRNHLAFILIAKVQK